MIYWRFPFRYLTFRRTPCMRKIDRLVLRLSNIDIMQLDKELKGLA